jgi:hypothetical protein
MIAIGGLPVGFSDLPIVNAVGKNRVDSLKIRPVSVCTELEISACGVIELADKFMGIACPTAED